MDQWPRGGYHFGGGQVRLSDQDIKRAIQQNVDVRYNDPNLVNKAFEYSEITIKQNDKTLLDATAAMDEQVRFFDLKTSPI